MLEVLMDLGFALVLSPPPPELELYMPADNTIAYCCFQCIRYLANSGPYATVDTKAVHYKLCESSIWWH